jgi:twitching motility protein PilT
MRDPEAIATALTAAETGHLVLATLHAPTAASAIERITGVYDGNAQRQIVLQLANTLQGVIAQELLPSVDRSKRVLACELMLATGAVRTLIRENRLFMLDTTLQTSTKEGMVYWDNCLFDLYSRTLISYDTALSRARNPDRISKQR